MNQIHRVLWNETTGTFTAVAETAKSKGKRSLSRTLRRAAVAGVLAMGAAAAMAGEVCELPDGTSGTMGANGVCAADMSLMSDIGLFSATMPSSPGLAIVSGGSATTGNANDIAIGNSSNGSSSAGAYPAIGIGTSATATGLNTIALGTGASATADAATAIGSNGSVASGYGSTAVGGTASGQYSLTFGLASQAAATQALAAGYGAKALGANAVAISTGATAAATSSIAIGNTANVDATAISGTAIGAGAKINANMGNGIALGSNSVVDRLNAVSVGSSAQQRQIVHVANGTAATDAVNVSQLTPVVTALGGGASVNPTTGAVTGPIYSLTNGGSQTTVDGALSGLDTALNVTKSSVATNATAITNLTTQLNSGAVGLVQQASATADITVAASHGGTAVDFAGTSGTRTLKGLTAGVDATDAVNMSQLNATNASVATNTTNIAANTANIATNMTNIGNLDGRVTMSEGDITNIKQQLVDIGDGTAGLVQQDATTRNVTVAAASGGAVVDFSGTDGTRTLSGVTAGVADTDAVNMSQLSTTNSNVAANTTNIAANTSNIGILDDRVTVSEGDITSIKQQLVDIGDGAAGLVQQDAVSGRISVAAATGGSVVDFSGSAGVRTLSGLADGSIAAGSSEAVTGNQLFNTNNAVSALGTRVGATETSITNINGALADLGSSMTGAVSYNADRSMVALGGAGGTMIDNLNNGIISASSMQAVNGSQLFNMQAAWDQKLQDLADSSDVALADLKLKVDDLSGTVADQGKQLGEVNDRVGLIETGIADGSIGGGGGSGVNPQGNAEIGNGASASGNNSSAIGSGAVASGDNSTAVGADASATGDKSTALGANASATGSNSVAIGAGSVADRDNSISFGSAGSERQLTNVADGTQATDAVNKRQLDGAIAGVNDRMDGMNSRIDRLDKRVDEMGAMSTAAAQMALSTAGLAGTHRLGVGIGAQNGQSALALGYQRVLGKGTRTLNLGGSASTRGTVSIGAGAGFSW